MTDVVDTIIDGIVNREGGFSDNAADKGGPTKFGITERVARANGYAGDMRELPIEKARDIYKTRYWIAPNLFKVADISSPIAEELLDTGVNMGVDIAVHFLQRALNALNVMGSKYADIKIDDHVGDATLDALRSYVKQRGPEGVGVMIKALNCLQGARYIELVEAREQNETFVYGWLNNRVG